MPSQLTSPHTPPPKATSGKIRVLVVDDSVVVRRLVTQALEQDPIVEVVGAAANGQIALTKANQLRPDLVTMDVEMPVMDGITAVRQFRAAGHSMPIIMCSTLTDRGAAATLDALTAGASDYVTKPAGALGGLEESLRQVASDLLPKVRALVPRATARATGVRVVPSSSRIRLASRTAPAPPVRMVVLGSSTGGPSALATVIGGLTVPPRVPVLIVQHMPPVFTRQLADRLDRLGPVRVVEAQDGQRPAPGVIHIAPGGRHMELRSEAGLLTLRLTDDPPVNYCRPAVDVLFRSAVKVLGGELLGVVLTGMGSDGMVGAGEIVTAGGSVLAQDEGTSVVWGMPGAVASAGHAHSVLPLAEIASAIERGIKGEVR